MFEVLSPSILTFTYFVGLAGAIVAVLGLIRLGRSGEFHLESPVLGRWLMLLVVSCLVWSVTALSSVPESRERIPVKLTPFPGVDYVYPTSVPMMDCDGVYPTSVPMYQGNGVADGFIVNCPNEMPVVPSESGGYPSGLYQVMCEDGSGQVFYKWVMLSGVGGAASVCGGSGE